MIRHIVIQLKKIKDQTVHFLRKKMHLERSLTLVMSRVRLALISLELFGDLIQEQALEEISVKKIQLIKLSTFKIFPTIIQ